MPGSRGQVVISYAAAHVDYDSLQYLLSQHLLRSAAEEQKHGARSEIVQVSHSIVLGPDGRWHGSLLAVVQVTR